MKSRPYTVTSREHGCRVSRRMTNAEYNEWANVPHESTWNVFKPEPTLVGWELLLFCNEERRKRGLPEFRYSDREWLRGYNTFRRNRGLPELGPLYEESIQRCDCAVVVKSLTNPAIKCQSA